MNGDQLTRTTAVPTWMVALVCLILTAALTTIGGVIVVDRHQMHENTAEIGMLRERMGRTEEKTKDILDALIGIRADLKELMRRMP